MAQRAYLLTSLEKFQQQRSSGSCNTGFPGPTGKKVAAILRSINASSSPTATQSSPPWEDTSVQEKQKDGELGVDHKIIPSLSEAPLKK